MNGAGRWSMTGVAVLSMLLLCQSCSKEASFRPLFEIDPSERFASDTLVAQTSAWFNKGMSAGPTYTSTRMVVCDWEGYDARAFLRFTAFPDTDAVVTSARLYLYATRVEGGGTFLNVHTLSDTLIQSELYWGEMPGISQEPVAEFALPAESGDSVFVDVTETVASWVKGDGSNYGFAIKARDDEGPEFLVEFATREAPTKTTIGDEDTTVLDLRPALRIAYVDTAGEDQTSVSIAAVDAFADTLVTPFPDDDLHLLCGSGFPSRAFVLFDVRRIPRGATVTQSILSLVIDASTSSFDSMGVRCHAVVDTLPWSGFDVSIGATGTETVTILAERMEADSTLKMDITALVQPLVARQETNSGFTVKASNETFDLDFVRFWSHTQPDGMLRPTLVVDYILPPGLPYEEVLEQ
jgi:hypothetical protein